MTHLLGLLVMAAGVAATACGFPYIGGVLVGAGLRDLVRR